MLRIEQDFCLLDVEGLVTLVGDRWLVGKFSLEAAGIERLDWGTYITVSKTSTSGSRSNICLRFLEVLVGDGFRGGRIIWSSGVGLVVSCGR